MLPTAADEPLAAAVFIFLVYGACFLLYVVVPGPIISGYARDARGKPLRYKLNSLRVFLITIFLTCCTSYGSVFPFTLPILQRMNCCLSTCVVGLSVSFVCYLKGPFKQHVSAHPTPAPEDVSVFKDPAQAGRMFFLGWELNPRFGLIDFKMYLYLAGAVMLQVNVLSGLAYHYSTNNNLSWPLIVYCCELSWFLLDYVYHEHVQLYTYDLFAENVGFKLAWGCLCFYPYFYSIGLPVLTEGKQGDVPAFALGTSAVLFVIGYILSRGANNQKYSFKVDPQAKFLGFLEQKSIGVCLNLSQSECQTSVL